MDLEQQHTFRNAIWVLMGIFSEVKAGIPVTLTAAGYGLKQVKALDEIMKAVDCNECKKHCDDCKGRVNKWDY